MLRIISDNLIYRAGSDRIPFSTGNIPGKHEHPYDIPRDHHDRALYDIPRNKLSTLSTTSINEISSVSEVTTSAVPSEYQQPSTPSRKNAAPVLVPNGNNYQIPSGVKAKPETTKPRVTSIFDDPEYIYMENSSETTDGDEESGGSHDKTSSEVNVALHCYGKIWVCVGETYGKCWFCQMVSFYTLPIESLLVST